MEKLFLIILICCILFGIYSAWISLVESKRIIILPRLKTEDDIKNFLQDYLLSVEGLSMAESSLVFDTLKKLWEQERSVKELKRLHYRLYTGSGEWFDLDQCNSIQKSIIRLFRNSIPPNKFKNSLKRCIDEKTS